VTKPYSSPPTNLRSLRDRLTQVAERQGVVFGRGSDCWLVMGYTGLAYFDDKPTDAFIASVLAGGRELTGMGMWFPGRPLHYREITRSVENAMFDAYSRLPAAARDHRTTLSGGWCAEQKAATQTRCIPRRCQPPRYKSPRIG
jgi:hypothetical protein